jgi:hypothetical protein
MMWSVYNRIILMVCILRICFSSNLKKIFLLRGNELEIQYLTCEEDIDEDLDEINLQSEDHESSSIS